MIILLEGQGGSASRNPVIVDHSRFDLDSDEGQTSIPQHYVHYSRAKNTASTTPSLMD